MEKEWNDRIEQYFSDHRQEIIDTLFALARIPSVQGAPVEGKPYGQAVADVLDKALALCEAMAAPKRSSALSPTWM